MSSVALRTPFWRLFPRFIQPLRSGKVFHPAGFPRAVNQCGVGRFHESIVPSFLLPNYKRSPSFADHSEKHRQGEDSHLATSGAPSTHPRGINVKLCKLLLAFPVFFCHRTGKSVLLRLLTAPPGCENHPPGSICQSSPSPASRPRAVSTCNPGYWKQGSVLGASANQMSVNLKSLTGCCSSFIPYIFSGDKRTGTPQVP